MPGRGRAPWANVSNAPFRLFKHWVHEGGISTPLIAQWPAKFKGPKIAHGACHVVDVLPTILDAVGASYPSELGGHALQALDGETLMPLLKGGDWTREQPIFWEHEGNCAVRHGNFKLVRKFNQSWELYDMEKDRTELDDLMGKNDPLTAKLIGAYDGWAEAVGVLDWNVALPRLMEVWRMEDIHG